MKTQDVIKHCGTAAKAGAVLGMTKAAISQWGEDVLKLRARELDDITKERLSY